MGSGQSNSQRCKARVHFSDAVAVLKDDSALTIPENEERWITLGRDALGRLPAVIYTWRADKVRPISARQATPRERRQYEENE
jgi:uncharacterized protein